MSHQPSSALKLFWPIVPIFIEIQCYTFLKMISRKNHQTFAPQTIFYFNPPKKLLNIHCEGKFNVQITPISFFHMHFPDLRFS